MKTTIMELIEFIKNYKNQSNFNADLVINILEIALEKEKEQIIDAYEAAMERPIENYAESYYNMNYNQNK